MAAAFAPTATDEFNAMVYGRHHPGTLDYLGQQYDSIASKLTDASRDFVKKSHSAFEWFQSSTMLNFARGVLKKANNQHIEIIKPLTTIAELQLAKPGMQRWIMANVNVRERWQKQRCDGFTETYEDIHPGDIGSAHYDWRRVMDSVVQADDEDWCVHQYNDTPLYENEHSLALSEKADILHTWACLDAFMALGEKDPTSAEGASL